MALWTAVQAARPQFQHCNSLLDALGPCLHPLDLYIVGKLS
eukprot:SAG25_NODE_11584_length_300_cov_6.437811_1_plen_40_part_10